MVVAEAFMHNKGHAFFLQMKRQLWATTDVPSPHTCRKDQSTTKALDATREQPHAMLDHVSYSTVY